MDIQPSGKARVVDLLSRLISICQPISNVTQALRDGWYWTKDMARIDENKYIEIGSPVVEIEPPTEEELYLLREKIDPDRAIIGR